MYSRILSSFSLLNALKGLTLSFGYVKIFLFIIFFEIRIKGISFESMRFCLKKYFDEFSWVLYYKKYRSRIWKIFWYSIRCIKMIYDHHTLSLSYSLSLYILQKLLHELIERNFNFLCIAKDDDGNLPFTNFIWYIWRQLEIVIR